MARGAADTGSGRLADLAWLCVGFGAAAAVSIAVSRVNNGIAGIWLANVFAFAMLARRKRPAVLDDHAALFIVSLVINLAFGSSPDMALLYAATNGIHIASALILVRQGAGPLPMVLPGARDFAVTLVLGGLAATSVVAGGFGLAANALRGWDVATAGLTWLSANALGFAIFLPPLLYISRREQAALANPAVLLRTLGVGLLCALVACGSLSFGRFAFVLAMLPLMIAAPRVSIFQLALVASFTGTCLVAVAMLGLVPDLASGTAAYKGGFPLAVAVTVATPFMVGLFLHQIMEDRKRIAELETRWNFALASARQGVWDADLKNNAVVYSPTWRALLGYEEDELHDDPRLWLDLAHPDDIERIAQADRDHMEGRCAYFEAEFRMRHKDGHWLWVLDRGRAVERDANGNAVRAIGSITDITQRKEAEARIAVSAAMLAGEKERLRVTLQSIGDAVICTDAADRVTFMNPVAETLTGIAIAEALGKKLDQVYRAVGDRTDLGFARAMIADEGASDQDSRAVLLRRDGSSCSIRQVVSPIRDDRGTPCGSVIVFQDFTDARALQRQLAYAASHDSLTGLANRSSFIHEMERLVANARAGGEQHQFMFIDLDRFKAVNDTSGHAAGDALLRLVADTIREALGPQAAVARLGGDEFAVLLRSSTVEDAKAAAAAVINAVEGLDFSWGDQRHGIGASIGVTTVTAGCGEADEIMARADAACYCAKAAGRGCVFVASPEQSGKKAPMHRPRQARAS